MEDTIKQNPKRPKLVNTHTSTTKIIPNKSLSLFLPPRPLTLPYIITVAESAFSGFVCPCRHLISQSIVQNLEGARVHPRLPVPPTKLMPQMGHQLSSDVHHRRLGLALWIPASDPCGSSGDDHRQHETPKFSWLYSRGSGTSLRPSLRIATSWSCLRAPRHELLESNGSF